MSFELTLLIKSTLILACAALANEALRRSSASTRHAVWTMALLCLTALPAVSFYFPKSLQTEVAVLPGPEVLHESVPAAMEHVAPTVSLPAPVSRMSPPKSALADSSLRTWILLAWIAGIVTVLLRTALAVVAARSLASRSEVADDVKWTSLITFLRDELDLVQDVELRIGGDLSPMTWGWRHPIILLPSSASGWTPERRKAVLTHELAHVKRRDGVTQILVQLACSVYWCHPAVWFAERRMRMERERACDDYVLKLGTGAAPYADHLLEIAAGSPRSTLLATVSMAQPSQLEIRLRAILNPALRRSSLSRGTALLLLSCILTLVISLAGVHVTTLLSMTVPAATAPGVPKLPEQAQTPPPAAPVPASTPAIPQAAPAPTRTIALIAVIDRSGSMAGSKMDLAKEGAKSALSVLRESDLYGVLTFDYAFRWALDLTEARNKDAMKQAIDGISAAGNTNIYPALREAFQRLQATTADTKHILLVSDGQTPAENFQGLVTDIRNNNITVSTVSVTAASDRQLMADIALWGRARAYFVQTGDSLPRIFQKEVEILINKAQ